MSDPLLICPAVNGRRAATFALMLGLAISGCAAAAGSDPESVDPRVLPGKIAEAPPLPDPVRATFLAHGFYGRAAREPLFVLSRSVPDESFRALLDEYASLDNNTIFVLFSGHDETVVSPYANQAVGGPVDEEAVRHATARLEQIRRRGLAVVGILFSDDTPAISQGPLQDLRAYQKLVVQRWERYVSAWCLAIEADEHLAARVGPLLEHLKEISLRPIFNHQLPGQTGLSLSHPFDGHLHQYGFGRSCEELRAETARWVPVFAAQGKKFIGLEYHLEGFRPEARALRECILAVPGVGGAG